MDGWMDGWMDERMDGWTSTTSYITLVVVKAHPHPSIQSISGSTPTTFSSQSPVGRLWLHLLDTEAVPRKSAQFRPDCATEYFVAA